VAFGWGVYCVFPCVDGEEYISVELTESGIRKAGRSLGSNRWKVAWEQDADVTPDVKSARIIGKTGGTAEFDFRPVRKLDGSFFMGFYPGTGGKP